MKPAAHNSRAGFTLIELMVTAMLMTLLALMTAQMWRTFSRQSDDLAGRLRAAQELRLGLEALSYDLGPAVSGTVDGDRLSIVRDSDPGSGGPAQVTVAYQLSGGQLIREDVSTGVRVAVADKVAAFNLHPNGNAFVEVLLAVQCGHTLRQATLRWSTP